MADTFDSGAAGASSPPGHFPDDPGYLAALEADCELVPDYGPEPVPAAAIDSVPLPPTLAPEAWGDVEGPQAPEVEGQGDSQRLAPVKLGNFLSVSFPPRRMLLAPIIAEQSLNMLYAPRGCGKTHVSIGIALAIATATPFLQWRAAEPRRVLIIDGEMPATVLQERLEAAVSRVDNPSYARENISILAADTFRDGLPDLSSAEGQEKLAPLLEGFDLIILDNLSTLCRFGKENEAESWGPVQGWALQQRRAGRSVLFIHHAGKGGDQRGTSRREDVLDTVMRLKRPDDYEASQGARFILEYTKARGLFGDEAEPFEAWLKDDGWTVRDATCARDERIVALDAEGLKQREIASELGCGLATVNRVLKRARGE